MTMMCGDPQMIQSYKDGKDLYSSLASIAFDTSYNDCLEFKVDENGEYILDKNGERIKNPAGDERRSQAKTIFLGVLYGRGVQSIADQLNCTKKKAEKIQQNIFKSFPAIKQFTDDSYDMANDLGYITTLWGRKRRLPIMTHPDYEFEWKDGASLSDDPLDFDDVLEYEDDDVPDDVIDDWIARLDKVWRQDEKAHIIAQAAIEGIKITDNSKSRIDATREIVNSRIQGSAADMSKLAMIRLYNDKRLRELGFRMLIPVHDEIIAECPRENAREVVERFSTLMSEAPGEKFTIPISCDVTVTDRWYGESVEI